MKDDVHDNIMKMQFFYFVFSYVPFFFGFKSGLIKILYEDANFYIK